MLMVIISMCFSLLNYIIGTGVMLSSTSFSGPSSAALESYVPMSLHQSTFLDLNALLEYILKYISIPTIHNRKWAALAPVSQSTCEN